MSLTTLSKKHRLFVEAYAGNEVDAMIEAGFVGAPNYLKQQAEKLLADPLIQEAIKERSRYMAKTFKVIADREERQATLTALMRNEDPHWREEKDANGVPIPMGNIPVMTRLKALELLGKSEGDFVENINLNANVSLSEMVMESYKDDTPIEVLEVEYYKVQEAKEQKKLEIPKVPKVEDFI